MRKSIRYVRKHGARFAWFLLDLIAGYGYRPLNCAVAYVLVVGGFSVVYMLLAHSWHFGTALITSIYSFHGRGLGSSSIPPGARGVSAAEAITGLLLEITFIATLTQRIFRQ